MRHLCRRSRIGRPRIPIVVSVSNRIIVAAIGFGARLWIEGGTTMAALLFAYGTLMPGDHEAVARGGWSPDAVRGRLYDLGPYPALVGLDEPAAGWVEGYVRPVEQEELDGPLDRWEDVRGGVYVRCLTTTRNHRRAWVYVYNRPLPPQARGPLPRWRTPADC
jgi:gamma-glutamylcyclotransferase (GGCT)/AIG2-like uncharacterized protein YtfP